MYAVTPVRISAPSPSMIVQTPAAHSAPGRLRNAARTASSAPGSSTSSAFSQPTTSPSASRMPLFMASLSPLSGSEMKRTPASRSRSSVPSVEPPSTTRCSSPSRSWGATEASVWPIVATGFRQGVTMVSVGVLTAR